MKKKPFRRPFTLTELSLSQQEAIHRLASAAENFCTLFEHAPEDPKQGLHLLHQSLAELYAAAVASPSTSGTSRSRHHWRIIKKTHKQYWAECLDGGRDRSRSMPVMLNEALGPIYYHMVFDPTEDTQAIHSGLDDDIIDIYRDLVRGLCLWKQYQTQLAWYAWRSSFINHWHRHATGALSYLQEAAICIEQANDPDEPLTLRQKLGIDER